MKVCFVTPYPLRMISGVSRVVTDLSKGLKERGIDHLVITARHRDDIEKDEAIEAIEINVSKLKNFRDVYLAIKTVIKILKYRRDIDILHLHSPHLPSFVSAILGRLFGKPVITTIHGKFPRPENFLKRLYFEITTQGTIAFSDKISFVDKGSKRHYNIPSGIVIENGIDIRVFSPDHELRERTRDDLELSENDVVLLYLGRLVAHKGIYDLLDAFSIVNTNTNVNIKLIIIGAGEVDKVSKKIKSLNLDNDVMLLGKVKKIGNYYRASDIFVLYTSPLEGLPIALLEASSCGLSIISTKVSGIPSLIKNEENGLLIDYGDINGLKQNIKRLIEDERLRKNIGDKARKKAVGNYNIRRTIDRYVDLYNEVLMDKR